MNRYLKLALTCLSLASVPLIMAPRNGAGTYQLPAGNPVVSGTVISSTVHNNTNSDIATALTASIAKDGQTTPTANLPMGAFRHTNVGNPTARNQYGTVDQIQDGEYVMVTAVAGTNTVTGSLAPPISAYVAGMHAVLVPANANTGAATLNLNGVGALDVQKYNSGGQVALAANDLRAGIPALLILDTGGDDWILVNPYSGSLGDVTVGTLTATTVNATTLSGAYNASGLTGSIADARLSANVALYNASMASFSSGTLPDARLSSNIPLLNGSSNNFSGGAAGGAGNSFPIAIDNNKLVAFRDSSGGFTNVAFIAQNGSNALVLGANGTTVGTITSTTANFTSTNLQHSGSRVNTIANTGRIAYGSVNGGTGALTNSLNVTSTTRTGAGAYTLDLTAAGFTATPVCVASQSSQGSGGEAILISASSTTAGSVTVKAGVSNADESFGFVCHGI